MPSHDSSISAPAEELSRLREAVRRAEQAEQLHRALFAISDLAASDLAMPEMMAQLHRIVAGLMYAENFRVILYDSAADALDFLYFVDVIEETLPAGTLITMANYEHALTWYLIRDRKPLRGSMEAIAQQVSGPLRVRGAASFDWMGVPMLEGSEARGALVVQSYEERERFSESDQALLTFVASHTLTALQRRQRRQELERAVQTRTAQLAEANTDLTTQVRERQRGERLQSALYRIAELANGSGSMEGFFHTVHEIVGDLVNVENFFIALVSADGSHLEFPYYVDEFEAQHPPRPLGKGVTEYVLGLGKPLLANREAIEQLQQEGVVAYRGPTPLVWLGAPLLIDGRPQGVLAVQSYSTHATYTERDKELLTFISHQITSSLERRRMTESLRVANAQLEQRVVERTQELQEQVRERERVELQLKHEVMHDSLTGLPNRSYLLDRLERVLGRVRRDPTRRFAVMFMDVDRFKVINDSVGHHAGDAVLQEVARRLSSQLRDPDMVARLGGDEFAVLIEEVRDVDSVVRIAGRLMRSMEPPMVVAGTRLFASTSIGIALSDPRYPTAEDLLRNADTAMYRAKVNGRQRFELFDEHLHNDAVRVLDLESALRLALKEKQFVPYFQPIVSLADGTVQGYEALLRWRHPERGVLGPADFLKVAEDNGSIEAIDWQMYAMSLEAIAGYAQFQGSLSVNVSPRHLRNAGFGDRLMELLQATGLDPRRLCLEITEGALIEDPERTSAMMQTLRAAGISLALDDFGTGYSSLGYLHRFPLTALKIDRSFVIPLDSATGPQIGTGTAVVRAILALAGSLGLKVVAEGIETEAQRSALMELGCLQGQGYLFARPGPLPQGHAAS